VANGTFYSHFRDREELEQAVAGHLADRLSHAVVRSFGPREDPAEWVAIGVRVFVGQVERDPDWGRTMLRFFGRSDGIGPVIRDNIRYDVQCGLDRGRFEAASATLAQDVIVGLTAAASQSVIEGNAPEGHAAAVAALVLRALGVPSEEAEEIAARPLPAIDEA
jgi:AcrR family transcriptional regulator